MFDFLWGRKESSYLFGKSYGLHKHMFINGMQVIDLFWPKRMLGIFTNIPIEANSVSFLHPDLYIYI